MLKEVLAEVILDRGERWLPNDRQT
jgi:hypothetical protein